MTPYVAQLAHKLSSYDVVDTTQGREVRAATTTDQRHTLVVTPADTVGSGVTVAPLS